MSCSGAWEQHGRGFEAGVDGKTPCEFCELHPGWDVDPAALAEQRSIECALGIFGGCEMEAILGMWLVKRLKI
jgi:hypothetical protein